MPSNSNLFVQLVFSLVARSAKAKGEVPLFCRSAANATCMLFGPLLKRVLFAVLGWCNQKKVFKAVVLGVTVLMVNVYAFWRARYPAMLVLPTVWLRNFYANVDQTIAGFMQFFCAYRKRYSNLGQHLMPHSFGFWRERFVCAVRTSWRVVIGVAVQPFLAYDLGAAKRAKFEWKFFGHDVVYTKHDRIANAF